MSKTFVVGHFELLNNEMILEKIEANSWEDDVAHILGILSAVKMSMNTIRFRRH